MRRGDFEFFDNIQTVRILGARPSGVCNDHPQYIESHVSIPLKKPRNGHGHAF